MNKEIEELLKGMRDVSNTEGCSMNLDRYLVKLLLSYIEQLENNRDKAIKYLEEKADYPISYYHCIREAIDILKGDSDE